MIKSAIKLMTLFFTCTLAFSLAGCSVGQEASEDGQANNEDAFQIVESNKEEISFDDANILEFKMDSRDDESYDEIIATYSVENTSVEPIYYFSADFSYKDASGNILCGDGRFNDFGIPADKKATMKTYSHLDGGYAKDDVAEIFVSSYEYSYEGKRVEIDLENRSVILREEPLESDADFDSSNLLSFEYEDDGISSANSYHVGVKTSNDGSQPITYISIDVAYFDSDGNLIGTDGRYNDDSVNPGNFVQMNSYLLDGEASMNVKSFGIYSYEYRLAQDDENGFNSYEVNLVTKEVSATHIDR